MRGCSLLDHFGCSLHIDFSNKGIAYFLVNHDVARGRYSRLYRILLGALSLGLFEWETLAQQGV